MLYDGVAILLRSILRIRIRNWRENGPQESICIYMLEGDEKGI